MTGEERRTVFRIVDAIFPLKYPSMLNEHGVNRLLLSAMLCASLMVPALMDFII